MTSPITLRNLAGIAALLILVGCQGGGFQTTVNPRAETPLPGHPKARPKTLAIFFDGTWNDISSRTNVRRLYELAAAQHRPNVLCYYDQGVGTGKLGNQVGPSQKYIGGGLGFGFQQNLREALTFLTEHWKPGDHIHIYGFSRGSYQGLALAGLIQIGGLPEVPDSIRTTIIDRAIASGKSQSQAEEQATTIVHQEASRLAFAHYARLEKLERVAAKAYKSDAAASTGTLHEQAQAYHDGVWKNLAPLQRWQNLPRKPEIEILGLWDPVEALQGGVGDFLGTTLKNTAKAEFARHRGHQFHNFSFGPHIKDCYIAFSLDEQRQAFMPELPVHRKGAEPRNYEFTWFVGDHSDVGAGHGDDKDLGGITMNWMLSRVADRLIQKGAGKLMRVSSNIGGARHDLAVSGWFEKVERRARGEVLSPDDVDPVKVAGSKTPFSMIPVRSKGWKMNIHQSVLDRMQAPQDWFESNTESRRFIDLKSESLRCPGSNPQGPYVPRPFRDYPVNDNAESGWVKRTWTVHDIRRRYTVIPYDGPVSVGISQ